MIFWKYTLQLTNSTEVQQNLYDYVTFDALTLKCYRYKDGKPPPYNKLYF